MGAIQNVLKLFFQNIYNVVPNYGLSIIVFTILIKIVLLPFNIMQTKSTVKMQLIQPKLKELQEKYKKNPEKLQEAQLALYKSEGVNPMAGCLPILIQMPILFAIFYVFRDPAVFQGGNAVFLGLNLVEPLKSAGPLPIALAFTALSGLSTFVSTWLLTPKNQEANAMSSNSTNIIMSVFFAYISFGMPAGLVVYWIVNNILQMGIQYALNKVLRRKVEAVAE